MSITPEQNAVILHEHGNALVAATAGSGKTFTMIQRILHLIRTGANPTRITAVMFNKAAREDFSNRLRRSDERAGAVTVRTFNSMGQKLEHWLVQQGALQPAKLVTAQHVQDRLARAALSEVYHQSYGADAWPPRELVDQFSRFISYVKTDVIPADEMLERLELHGVDARLFPRAFELFEEERARQKLRFYADQIYDPVRLLLQRPDLAKKLHGRLSNLIVDESQDINRAQIHLVRLIAQPDTQVMLVGDDDQTIYTWRGADANFLIKEFEREFAPVTKYPLSRTFRFGHELAIAANHLITRNTERIDKLCVSDVSCPDTRVELFESKANDVDGLARMIRAYVQAGGSLADIAVICRLYSFSVPIEIELLKHQIDYFVLGRAPLINVTEISAMIAVLTLVSGRWLKDLEEHERHEMLKNLLSTPSLFLKSEVVDQLVARMAKFPARAPEVLRAAVTPQLKASLATRIRDRADILESLLSDELRGAPPADILEAYVAAVDLREQLQRQNAQVADAEEQMRNVEAFIALARAHQGDAASFLASLDPLVGMKAAEPPATPHVLILSAHRAKGLEYPWVIVPGLARGMFPSDRPDEHIEDERRLAYVAFTRAKKRLTLIVPRDEKLREEIRDPGFKEQSLNEEDDDEPQARGASTFVYESRLGVGLEMAANLRGERAIPLGRVIEAPDIANRYLAAVGRPPCYTAPPQEAIDARRIAAREVASNGEWRAGEKVYHVKYGAGVVQREAASGGVVQIRFDDGSTRLIMGSPQYLRRR